MFLNSIRATDEKITPEYIVIVLTIYPMFVIGFKSPSPTVIMVIKVNQTEF